MNFGLILALFQKKTKAMEKQGAVINQEEMATIQFSDLFPPNFQ